MSHLLEVDNLAVSFHAPQGAVEAVRGATFSIDKGETLALVGESGSGKSVTALSIPQLLPYPAAFHPSGSVRLNGEELMGASDSTLRQVRGGRIALIFQEPMTSLNPLHTIGRQVSETLRIHQGMGNAAARDRTVDLLRLVGLKDVEDRLLAFGTPTGDGPAPLWEADLQGILDLAD